jgi:hypothetical protein
MSALDGADSSRQLVQRYLQLCEQRQVSAADALLAADAVLEFPGAKRYSCVREMATDAVTRYRSIEKTITEWRAAALGHGVDLVVCSGTLSGIDVSGAPFSGVRFVDVFEVSAAGIHSQRVWNDLAENGVIAVHTGPRQAGAR